MNKRELMELLFTREELNRIDTAYPQPWADHMRECGIDPRNFVWSYNEPTTFGGPVHLGDRLIEKFGLFTDHVHDADLDDHIKRNLIKAFELVKGGMNVS